MKSDKDIVWHLRDSDCAKAMCSQAADEIEKLRTELAQVKSDRDAKTVRMWELGKQIDQIYEIVRIK